jgi:hypothetical protein
MMGVALYLSTAAAPEGPARALSHFRRLIMGRGVLALGGAAELAAIVLALLATRQRSWAMAALLLAGAWIALCASRLSSF